MRRVTLPFITLFVALAVCPPCHAAERRVLFVDSSMCYVFTESKDLKAGVVREYLRRKRHTATTVAIRALFDSLGFFNGSVTPLTTDTMTVIAGERTTIDSIRLLGGVTGRVDDPVPLTIDSVTKVKLPRPYDQGEIRAIAAKALSVLGTKGYPFATLSVSLSPLSPGRGMTVVLSVRDNGRYAFAKPLFTGNITTSRRLLQHDVLFADGDVFDLRKVEQSRQRLLLRPYIRAVNVGPPAVLLDAALTPEAQQSLEKVLVPFACEDERGLGFDGAIAFNAGAQSASESFSGVVNISLLNLLHGGEAAEVSYNGQKDYSKLSFSLAKPYLFDVPVFASGDFGLEILAEQNGFLHGGLEGLTEFAAAWQLGLGLKGHEVWDTGGEPSEYLGVDIILSRPQERLRAGTRSQGLEIRTGSGLAHNNNRQFDRWHVDITGSAHMPLTARQAISCRAVGRSMFTKPGDSLQTVELYRTGGYRSVRGYADNEFAFKTVFYVQAEYLVYFSPEGAVYAFTDAGAGFGPTSQLNAEGATRMLSYGVGLRIPVKIGSATVEWARNYKETRSLGRVHVSIQNRISAALGK